MVFAGLYTVDAHEHTQLREALEKLRLNDSSFFFEPESSVALGFGFRCGFLGLLHMEIIQERLEREFNLELITTAPGVRYKITKTDGTLIEVDNPSRWPDPSEIAKDRGAGHPGHHSHQRRIRGRNPEAGGRQARQAERLLSTSVPSRVMLHYELPLNEIVLDFYDRLKSVSRGYASLDYHLAGYWESPMVKLDILVAGEPVDALSIIVHRDFAYERGEAAGFQDARTDSRGRCSKSPSRRRSERRSSPAKPCPPSARTCIAKCYGGDITRKRKLLEKQKEGKRRMKRIGRVDIPQEAFLAVLKVGEDELRSSRSHCSDLPEDTEIHRGMKVLLFLRCISVCSPVVSGSALSEIYSVQSNDRVTAFFHNRYISARFGSSRLGIPGLTHRPSRAQVVGVLVEADRQAGRVGRAQRTSFLWSGASPPAGSGCRPGTASAARCPPCRRPRAGRPERCRNPSPWLRPLRGSEMPLLRARRAPGVLC